MPWGQKNSSTEMIQSQTVTPPLAAIDGTTFRLKTATTNSSTRSQRPRTRLRCGGFESDDKGLLVGQRYRLCMGVFHELENAIRLAMVTPTAGVTNARGEACRAGHHLIIANHGFGRFLWT